MRQNSVPWLSSIRGVWSLAFTQLAGGDSDVRVWRLPACGPLAVNLDLSACKHIVWRHISDGAVQPDVVITVHILLDQAFCIFERKRRSRSNAFAFQRLVLAFQLSVRLRISRRGADMRHARGFQLRRDTSRGGLILTAAMV